LVTVIGLVALVAFLLLPVVVKARAAAQTASCLSNLRQMGAALTMYMAEHHGRLVDYVWNSPDTPDLAWNGYWLGALGRQNVKGQTLLCPAAPQALGSAANHGFGNATSAWTGRFEPNGSVIRFDATTYRESSYGYNRHLTAGGWFGDSEAVATLHAVTGPSDVPAMMDCAYADVTPRAWDVTHPVRPPPNLRGQTLTPDSPEHWRFLLARHGRGINMCMADGSARWVRLDDTYLLTWKAGWVKYGLDLPAN
jgi:prepilin-type processing-associated H-X9-DG protein